MNNKVISATAWGLQPRFCFVISGEQLVHLTGI